MPEISKHILAIESAVRGGSIALLRGGEEVASICGGEGVSRAEDLLPNIKRLLAGADIEPKDLDLVSVSRGPGSFTGIRIGIATAMGLARSLEIPVVGVPLLNAIAAEFSNAIPLAAAAPLGRSDIAYRIFPDKGSIDSPAPGNIADSEGFERAMDSAQPATVFLHDAIYGQFADRAISGERCVNIGENMAAIIGKHARQWLDTNDLSPIYLQNPARAGNLF